VMLGNGGGAAPGGEEGVGVPAVCFLPFHFISVPI
jgi:hypothetical protein